MPADRGLVHESEADDFFKIALLERAGIEAEIVFGRDIDSARSGFDIDDFSLGIGIADVDVARGSNGLKGEVESLGEAEIEN